VGWEKVVCWSTKAAISLKRVQIEEKLLWRAYRNLPTLFPTATSLTPCGLPFPMIGVRNFRSKLQSLLSQERVKLRTSNLARKITGSIRTKAREKFWRKGSVGLSRDYPFLGTPYYLTNGKSYGFQIWPVHSEGPSEQKAITNFGEKKSVGVSRDCPDNILWHNRALRA